MRELFPKQSQLPKGSDGPLTKSRERRAWSRVESIEAGDAEESRSTSLNNREEATGAGSPFEYDFSRVRSHGDGPGRPLDAGVRLPLERFLDHGLDHVRVIAGPGSRTAADQLGAAAFTHGSNIHLGSRGEGLTGSRRTRLLAHEAVHTLQQLGAPPVAQRSAIEPDVEGSPQERQAEGLARAFMAHERGHSAGLAIRDSIGRRPLVSSRVQLLPVSTTYGEFEDYKFNDVKDSGGASIGVQLYLKFHPGEKVDATKIGLAQAVKSSVEGVRETIGNVGRRQAVTGAGAGYYIDRVAGRPSPLYGTVANATAGQDAAQLGSYADPGIHSVTSKDLHAADLDVTGIDYGGGSVFGYRYMDKGMVKGPEPAEMHDTPLMAPARNSSEDIFETAALAFEGSMAGTYLGSVEWGWRRDAEGAFTPLPISMKSMGVPTVNFLTAASIWNPAMENFGYFTTADPTPLFKRDTKTADPGLEFAFNVPVNTSLKNVSSANKVGAEMYRWVEIDDGSKRKGFVCASDMVEAENDYGRDTVDLPVPETYTVSLMEGAVLDGEKKHGTDTPRLPSGTRVEVLGVYADAPGYVRVRVADGLFTDRRGILRQSDLTRETLGTR